MTIKSSDLNNDLPARNINDMDIEAEVTNSRQNIDLKIIDDNEQEEDDVEDEDNDPDVNHIDKKYAQKNENIKLLNMNNNNNNNKTNLNNRAKEPKHQPTTFLARLDNILDLNLKFKLDVLEKHYVKSYLSVTRRLFINYLFYLVIFCLCWIVFFFIENGRLDSFRQTAKVQRYELSNQKLKNENSIILNDNLNLNFDSNVSIYYIDRIVYEKNEIASSNVLTIFYLLVIVIFFAITFSFLIVAEIKEIQYRNLEKSINKQETQGKFDTKTAERDLKLAMKDVIDKEVEIENLKAKLDLQYKSVDKLRDLHSKIAYTISLFVILCMFLLCFILFAYPPASLNQITHFIWFCESIMLLYLIYPFHMGVSIILGTLLSLLFEIFTIQKQLSYTKSSSTSQIISFIIIKILLHTSIHLIGVYLKLSFEGVKRGTFLKVAHMHKAHMTAQQDKKTTERMIKSIMPPLFTHVFGKPEEFKKSVNTEHLMRPLFIYPVSELSILFADIVGFTKMSSTKTAQQLVFLLNDLYGRFDKLCEQAGCEKISTLGDCYYCVSGCLNDRKDHAICCVEMGLLMVKEIELFNKAHDVDVNMRVGVHTGNALCGFIGGKRFRFDVWSGDVTLANKMESSGRAGWVHISEDTYKHLQNRYNTEPGEKYSSKNTYFVVRDTKRATVAEALKQSNATNNMTAFPLEESNANLDKTKNEDELANKNETASNKDLSKIEILDDESLLLLAVKNAQFFQPDVNMITMRFGAKEERRFQNFLMGKKDQKNQDTNRINANNELLSKKNNLWVNTNNTLFLSILISFLVNICVSTAYFLTFLAASSDTTSPNYNTSQSYSSNLILMIILFVIFILVHFIFLLLNLKSCSKVVKINKFSIVHIISAILLSLTPILIIATSLPIVCNIIELSWAQDSSIPTNDTIKLNLFIMYCFYCYVVALIHFCSFFQLGSLFKTTLVLIFIIIYGFMGFIGVNGTFNQTKTVNTFSKLESVYLSPGRSIQNNTNIIDELFLNDYALNKIEHSFSFYTTLFLKGFLREHYVILLDLTLLFVLIWLVNRQSELIQRLSFKCDQNAQAKVTYAREQKELANWLIEVVLPSHVVDHVQEKKQYSKNHECVGVLFVSLCNFWEFFEESYEGGRELLRVLNEITIDFDRLFDEPRYKNVEKIKSIGSTFMIASGLNPDASQDESDKTHLYDLMDFALELNEKLESFNNEAMSVCHFKFQMRMGFNCGPVTSGIIGTERLLYDIWGDTVNVASRMDSTGQAGLLQVPQKVAFDLKENYKFNLRGPIQIKGKDEMITYFLNPKDNKKMNLNS